MEIDAAVITSFAGHYPDSRFDLEDESGSALSLLLAARDDLEECEPAAAAKVNAALPTPYRSTPPPPATTG